MKWWASGQAMVILRVRTLAPDYALRCRWQPLRVECLIAKPPRLVARQQEAFRTDMNAADACLRRYRASRFPLNLD